MTTLTYGPMRMFQASGAPSSSNYEFTIGSDTVPVEVGNFYQDTSTGQIYQVESVNPGVSATYSDAISNKLVQRVVASNTTQSSVTSIIPIDNTIPQITEGSEIITVTITPTSASNIIELVFNTYCNTGTGDNGTVAFFIDSTANAIQAQACTSAASASGDTTTVTTYHREVAGSTSARTYRVRMGPSGTYLNVNTGGITLYGGVSTQYFIASEYQV